jgi:branched-chain amino acid transport system ATP-binding protein
MAFLDVEKVTMRFGGLQALSSVDLKIPKGSIRGLIGPNGSGKTTLFNVITGIYKPFSGKIEFEGLNITGMSPHRITKAAITRTFQNIQLFNEMTVLDNIKIGKHCRTRTELLGAILKSKRSKKEEKKIEEEVLDIAEFLKLGDVLDELPKNLPYGQQRLVELGRSLATSPKLILLDEPSAGMNTQEIEMLMQYIYEIHKQGYTILVVEHHMRLIMQLCDYIFTLNFGQKIAEGSPEEIQNNQQVVEAYLGTGAGF